MRHAAGKLDLDERKDVCNKNFYGQFNLCVIHDFAWFPFSSAYFLSVPLCFWFLPCVFIIDLILLLLSLLSFQTSFYVTQISFLFRSLSLLTHSIAYGKVSYWKMQASPFLNGYISFEIRKIDIRELGFEIKLWMVLYKFSNIWYTFLQKVWWAHNTNFVVQKMLLFIAKMIMKSSHNFAQLRYWYVQDCDLIQPLESLQWCVQLLTISLQWCMQLLTLYKCNYWQYHCNDACSYWPCTSAIIDNIIAMMHAVIDPVQVQLLTISLQWCMQLLTLYKGNYWQYHCNDACSYWPCTIMRRNFTCR